ncbi:hypothetical protein QFZ75_008030 [Streptomyces sp. V3I8]|uniref:hypothetical protein n=1 Tax=Streptomyces sp. V3I8 TaxID=3042279 RepID=UPI002784EC7B|nr:hypothetical protein [Streptomyces sp. V3I8]MDQ1041528.1 hypothetical protein [Streptomyces sp. V3I8]
MPQPPAAECSATATLHGAVQTCAKSPEHTDSTDPGRRTHHDTETGARWPSRPGDADPLAGFVRYTARQEF